MKTRNRKPLLAITASLALCVASIEAEAQILGTAETFGVLGGSAVTNTGPSVITGILQFSVFSEALYLRRRGPPNTSRLTQSLDRGSAFARVNTSDIADGRFF